MGEGEANSNEFSVQRSLTRNERLEEKVVQASCLTVKALRKCVSCGKRAQKGNELHIEYYLPSELAVKCVRLNDVVIGQHTWKWFYVAKQNSIPRTSQRSGDHHFSLSITYSHLPNDR